MLFCSNKIGQLHHRSDWRLTVYHSTHFGELRLVWPISWRRARRCNGIPEVCLQRGGSPIRYSPNTSTQLFKFLRAGGLYTP